MQPVTLFRRREKYFYGRALVALVHVVMLISLQHQASCEFLLYRQPSIIDVVFKNIAVLYGLPSSSGSHHFVTTKSLYPRQSIRT